MWVSFFDLATGGEQKTPYDIIFINASTFDKALDRFEEIFGFYPDIGSGDIMEPYDFGCYSSDNLNELSAHYRGCQYDEDTGNYFEEQTKDSVVNRQYYTLNDFLKLDSVFVSA